MARGREEEVGVGAAVVFCSAAFNLFRDPEEEEEEIS